MINGSSEPIKSPITQGITGHNSSAIQKSQTVPSNNIFRFPLENLVIVETLGMRRYLFWFWQSPFPAAVLGMHNESALRPLLLYSHS